MSPADFKATRLEDMVRRFDPRRPLDGAELPFWFVQRPNSPRLQLAQLLRTSREKQKVLFIGHLGNGKSTELRKLSEELGQDFHTVSFDALEVIGRTSLDFEDLMLAIAQKTMRSFIEADLAHKPLLEPIGDAWRKINDFWVRLVAGSFDLPSTRRTRLV